MNEIEKEEKEKLWYYSQLQGLSKRLDELPHVETVSARSCPGFCSAPPRPAPPRPWRGAEWSGGPALARVSPPLSSPRPTRPSQQFSMQMDLIRQQLEFEAQHIRSLMEERFGTSDEMVQRAQVRLGRSLGGAIHQREDQSADIVVGGAQILLMGGVICLRANQRTETPAGGA